MCDHSYFHELHAKVLIPWTTRPLPAWLARFLPLNIAHKLTTLTHRLTSPWLRSCPWPPRRYIGPTAMCFHVPFTIGNLKVMVCTTPVEGHASVMRWRTHVDSHSPLIWAVGWLVAGVAVSQLAADINIMQHRTRLKKPLRQFNDGPPTGKISAWLKQFYSE